MSSRDKCIQMLSDMPDYKIGYVLAYMQGLLADEEVKDDAFCEALYREYLDDEDPEKHEAVSLQSFADELGITL